MINCAYLTRTNTPVYYAKSCNNKIYFLSTTTTEGKCCDLFSVACPLMANALAYSTAAVCILFKLRHTFDLFESLAFVEI
jgi:hypothetical protein